MIHEAFADATNGGWSFRFAAHDVGECEPREVTDGDAHPLFPILIKQHLRNISSRGGGRVFFVGQAVMLEHLSANGPSVRLGKRTQLFSQTSLDSCAR